MHITELFVSPGRGNGSSGIGFGLGFLADCWLEIGDSEHGILKLKLVLAYFPFTPQAGSCFRAQFKSNLESNGHGQWTVKSRIQTF